MLLESKSGSVCGTLMVLSSTELSPDRRHRLCVFWLEGQDVPFSREDVVRIVTVDRVFLIKQ